MTINNILQTLFIVVFVVYLMITLIVGRFLAYHDMFIKRKHPNGSVELAGYDYDDVEFKGTDNITLRGWFIRSQNNPTNKTLFVVHGWTRSRSKYLPQIKFFVDSGYHVFAFDQRSHGASDTGRMTYGPKEGEDLLAAIEFAKITKGINAENIGAVGFSLGAIAVLYASIKQIFKAIVLEGVFADSYDMGEEILVRRVGKPLTHLFGYGVFWVGAMIWTFGQYKHSHPVDFISKVSPTPVMIIRGNKDERVPEASAKKMLDAVKDPKEIWIHEGRHTKAYNQYPKIYKEKVLQFFSKYL